MRQRRAKNMEERMDRVKDYLCEDPKQYKGRWEDAFGTLRPTYLEIGCGKGQFILKQAKAHPKSNYIAAEGQQSVLLHALEKHAKFSDPPLTNVRFIGEFIHDLGDYFERGDLSGIFINFCDPWPKDRHTDRRLMNREYLLQYAKLIGRNGLVEFKTDNDELFDFVFREALKLEEEGIYEIREMTHDLHAPTCLSRAKEITTEYEDKFLRLEKNIHYMKLKIT